MLSLPKTGAAKKNKKTVAVSILSLMKNEGLSYPTHFVKIGGSDIRKNLHELRIKQVNIFA